MRKKKVSAKSFMLLNDERARLRNLKQHLGLKSEADVVRLALKKLARQEGLEEPDG